MGRGETRGRAVDREVTEVRRASKGGKGVGMTQVKGRWRQKDETGVLQDKLMGGGRKGPGEAVSGGVREKGGLIRRWGERDMWRRGGG